MLSMSCRKFSTSLLSRGRVGVFSQGVKVSSRLLCTAKPPNDNNNEHKEKKNSSVGTKSFYETWKPHTMKIGMGAAASLTLYGLSSFMWDMTYNIMTMSPASGMYYGFVSGVGLTSITAASMYYVRTATKVDANEILLAARKSLNSSEDLRSLLGGYIYVGELAGFRHTYGSFKISGFRPKWKAPKIEMIFNVYSGKNEGIATISASQNGLYGNIDFLGVDVLNKTVTRVLVEGEAGGFEMHDTLNTLITFKTTTTDPHILGQD